MRVAYFINTFKSTNWGGQATSSGIQYLINREYPNASFVPLDLPDLPFKKLKIFRSYYENSLLKAILEGSNESVIFYLKKMNIQENFFDEFSHVCFNGEGAVHYKSGHLIRFLGILYLAKIKGKKVASINQTVDLNNNVLLEKALVKVYENCDFVSVREPVSYDFLKRIGLNNCQIIPDAVYGLPILERDFILKVTEKYELNYKNYITMTGSSFLDRNSSSVEFLANIIQYTLNKFKDKKIVFLSNAKTDFYLVNKVINKNTTLKDKIIVIDSHTANFSEAMALIASSCILIGGRQHPNIFAFIYKTPYIPFDGNTYKNLGVAKLQDYPIEPLKWSTGYNEFSEKLDMINQSNFLNFKDIKINEFKVFG